MSVLPASETLVQPSVLIIDDDPHFLKVLSTVLTQYGYQVFYTEDSTKAIDMYKHVRPDLVVLDLVMPEVNGYEILRKLRITTNSESLPIVVSTSLNDFDAIDNAFANGATDFVVKPYQVPILHERLKNALRVRSLIVEREKDGLKLRQANQLAGLSIYEMDASLKIFHSSEELYNFLKMSTSSQNKLKTLHDVLNNFVPDSERNRVGSKIRSRIKEKRGYDIEHLLVDSMGGEHFVRHVAEPVFNTDQKRIEYLVVLQDITKFKNSESLVEFYSNYDGATNLPNRSHFTKKLKLLSKRYDGTEQEFIAMLIIKLDRFSTLMSSYTRKEGDEIIKTLASRLSQLFNGKAYIAKLEGPAFGIILENQKAIASVEESINDVLAVISTPVKVEWDQAYLTACIGIAFYPFESESIDTVLHGAETALTIAKKRGSNQYEYYSHSSKEEIRKKISLEQELRVAVKKHEFVVFYQPKIDTRSDRVCGLEALVRWAHPAKGLIPPMEFIPLAEEVGLIEEIGNLVMGHAILEGKQLQKSHSNLKMAVNLSMKQFVSAKLVKNVELFLNKYEFDPANLEMEITESTAMYHYELTVAKLKDLRAMGVEVSIDDFGTGFSSLSYLQRLPVDEVKIDRSFIMNIENNNSDGVLAKSIIAMAHGLNLRVVAEGVETAGQYSFLKENQCDIVQGYYFSKPKPYEDIKEFLSSQQNVNPIK